jgi:hypothetical protein
MYIHLIFRLWSKILTIEIYNFEEGYIRKNLYKKCQQSTPAYSINKHMYALKDLYSVFCSYFLFHYTTVYSNSMLQS